MYFNKEKLYRIHSTLYYKHKSSLAISSESNIPMIAFFSINIATWCFILSSTITSVANESKTILYVWIDTIIEWNINFISITMWVGTTSMSNFLLNYNNVFIKIDFFHRNVRNISLTVPPVTVIEHPEVVFNVLKHRIALQLTWSSDVHFGLLRLLQPPDDEIPIPTPWIWASAAECECLQPIAV